MQDVGVLVERVGRVVVDRCIDCGETAVVYLIILIAIGVRGDGGAGDFRSAIVPKGVAAARRNAVKGS